MKLSIGNEWTLKLKNKVEAYHAIAGIKNAPRREAQKPRSIGQYAGGSVRKLSPARSGQTNTEVAAWVMNYAGNIFTKPFRIDSNRDIVKFSGVFIQELLRGKGPNITKNKRVINLMQAIIRNPILRGDYRLHDEKTAKKKGFTRSLIDTGQFFRSIQVEIRRKVGRV